MQQAHIVCGRRFDDHLVERINQTVEQKPKLSRYALSRQVCEWMDWKGPNGRYQDRSCRVAMLKLHRKGVITLPPPKREVRFVRQSLRDVILPLPIPIECGVEELEGLELIAVDASNPELSGLWNKLIDSYHYLGYQPLVGAQRRYLIRAKQGLLGAIGFSAAAWAVKARDEWIGWSPEARRANLKQIVCNSRFLILPWVKVPNLASQVLAMSARRLSKDWEDFYGYQPVLLETYVESERFKGSCYRAANWIRVGQTQGRGKKDREHRALLPVKDVYLYPLQQDFRICLRREPLGKDVPTSLRPSRSGSDWAEEEFGQVTLKDERLKKRLLTLTRDFYARPEANIPEACGTRAKTKAAYRFFDHPEVKMKEVLASHYQATAQRMASEKVVLALQDTTSFNYTTHEETEGLGTVGYKENAMGIHLHETLAVNVEGVALGLLDAQCWARDPAEYGKRHKRYELPIEQKESYKWLRSFKAVAEVQRQLPDTTVVSVGDREADLYDLFVLAASDAKHPKLLIRAEQARILADGQGHLWEHVANQALAGTQMVQVPRRRGGQASRETRLEVRFASVMLKPPKRKPALGKVSIRAVLAREVEAPEGVKPIEWMLLTTLPVADLEQAVEKLMWYGLRWQIEVFHKILKSGTRMEARQLRHVDRLENCLAIDLVVAWRILHMTRLGRKTPDVPCTVVFEDYEWKALYSFVQKTPNLPEQVPRLQETIRMVARLGGFLARKGDGEPGPKRLWRGLQRLDDIAAAWKVFTGPGFASQSAPQMTVSSKQDYG